MNRVIITGPTGAVGMALMEYLTERSIQVIAVVRKASPRKERIRESENILKVECALSGMSCLPQKVREAVRRKGWKSERGMDVFFHFAWEGTSGDGRNDMYLQNRNIKYALEAADAAAELGCGMFIGAGSQAEYGRCGKKLNARVPAFPENGYGMAKLCAGQMTRIRCAQKGVKHVWARILSVYGPYDGDGTMVAGCIKKMLEGVRVPCTAGGQVWDYLYAKNVAKMMYLLGIHGADGMTYCLGSGEERPLREYIEMIRSIVNPDAEIGYGDIPYLPGQVMYLCADIQDLVRDTGYVPDYTFEEGIRQTVEWYRENKA